MSNNELTQLVLALIKIALMVFTALHFFFMLYVLRRIFDMQKQLSSLKQQFIIGIDIAFCIGLLVLIVYIIILPT